MLAFCLSRGMSKKDFNELTMFECDYYFESNSKKRETTINDSLYIAYEQSKLISLAVWGSKDFPSKVPSVSFNDEHKGENSNRVITDMGRLLNLFDAMCSDDGGEK